MRPSGSRLGLAMKCIGSCLLPGVRSGSEAAEAGTARHEFLAALHAGVPRELALMEVEEGFRDTCDAMDDGALLPRIAGLSSEVAYAYDPEAESARRMPGSRHRDYSSASKAEYCATLDYSGNGADGALRVYDLKTGMSAQGRPIDSWQLRIGALMVSALERFGPARGAVTAGLLIARDGMKTKLDEVVFSADDLDSYRDELVDLGRRIDAAEASGVDNSSLALGPHCRNCPARLSCPAQAVMIRSAVASGGAELLEVSARVSSMTSDELTSAWQRAAPLFDAVKELKAAFAEAAKAQPFATSPGMEYGLRKTVRTEIDGPTAYAVAVEIAGADAAREFVEFGATKASVERGVGAAMKLGLLSDKSRAAALRRALEMIDKRGGFERITTSRLDEHAVG